MKAVTSSMVSSATKPPMQSSHTVAAQAPDGISGSNDHFSHPSFGSVQLPAPTPRDS